MDSTHRAIRVGVFGVGSLGQHHARIYSEMEGADLVGIFDVDSKRAAELADQFGTQPFSDIEALAAEIEAASVVVPTDRHFEVFNTVMKHDLHLMVEKPIATSEQEAEAMVRTARQKGRILQVGHIERFNPVMAFLEEHLVNARFIEASRLASYPPPREGLPPRGTEVSVVLDLMIHDLEIILHLVKSPVKEIHAVGVPVLSPTEDIANVRLLFENGCVANVTASRISQDRLRKIRIFQEDTYVSLDYGNLAAQMFKKTAQGIEPIDIPIEAGDSDALTAELTSFLNCVATQGEPVVSGEHGSNALRLALDICDAIRESPS